MVHIETGKLRLRKIRKSFFFFLPSKEKNYILNAPKCQKYHPWLKLTGYRGIMAE